MGWATCSKEMVIEGDDVGKGEGDDVCKVAGVDVCKWVGVNVGAMDGGDVDGTNGAKCWIGWGNTRGDECGKRYSLDVYTKNGNSIAGDMGIRIKWVELLAIGLDMNWKK